MFIETSPTLSFRTLKPIKNKQAPYIKLPIAIQATSILRTLSHSSVINSPLISDLLKIIFEKENNFNGNLKILPEICGAYLCNVPAEDSKHLSIIFRESIDKNLNHDEYSITIASLFELSPISKLPILIEKMKLSGVNSIDDAIIYFEKYAEMIVCSYLDLYLIYGVALEGHQQNTFAVFENNIIKYFIARDFDGVDINETAFKQGYKDIVSDKLHSIFSKKPEVSRNNLLHTVYQSHLGEVIILISTYFKCSEATLWGIVAKLTQKRFMLLRPRINRTRWNEEYNAILIKEWNCKALLRMRLIEEYNRDGLFFRITNPLSLLLKEHPNVK